MAIIKNKIISVLKILRLYAITKKAYTLIVQDSSQKVFPYNDARAIIIYNTINLIKKKNLFKDMKTILNVGSFDLLQNDNISLGVELLNKLGFHSTKTELNAYVDTEARIISSKILWEKLGFIEIFFVDLNRKHDSIHIDMNMEIDSRVLCNKTFDVVANFGTTEHIFNQFQTFKNIHSLCQTNGLMIHSVPLQGALNHGFFNYHPNFFFDLAQANNYKIEYAGVRHKKLENYNWIELGNIKAINNIFPKYDLGNPIIESFLKKISAYDILAGLFILRKGDDQEFRIPLQGKYKNQGNS